MAIQVRADGETTFFVEREPVFRSPTLLKRDPDNEWRVLIHGRSVGTQLLIRDLLIWPEPRFADAELSSGR